MEAAVTPFVKAWLVHSSQDLKGMYTAEIILSELGDAVPKYEQAVAAVDAVADKLQRMKKAVGAA